MIESVVLMFNGCRCSEEGQKPTNIHIAHARLIGEPELSESLYHGYATICFNVVDVLFGDFPTNKIRVSCYDVTVPPKIPSEVLLILQSPEDMCERGEVGRNVKADPSGFYYALGGDAKLGILDYTRENREKVANVPPLRLMDNRRGDWLPMKKAIEIAVENAQRLFPSVNVKTYIKISARRDHMEYAWSVYFVWSDIMGEHTIFIIGDDGELKHVLPGC